MSFNYNEIPQGFYDKIFDSADGVRKFWHWHKFDSVQRCFSKTSNISLLDVGCFSGSFIGRFVQEPEVKATGIDILPAQIEYANDKFHTAQREFLSIVDFQDATKKLEKKTFDVVTFIEVIEHLNPSEIVSFFDMLDSVTHKGSQIVITTPNYISMWPALEYFLNHYSDVTYEEQHIVKFNFFNIEKKLSRIVPDFSKKYDVTIKTSSHFLTPLISFFSYKSAIKFSTNIHPLNWGNPFGCIIILKIVKK